MTLNLRIPEQQDLKPRIIVFGIGGAGGNAVDNMIAKNLEGADFVVANTDAQALQQSSAGMKLQLGTKVTEGLGAGAKPEVGTMAAQESIDQVIDTLQGSHMCFITAGMGGGTGTGAAPVIAQAAREMGVLTVGVVTKPFQFEGIKRMAQAESGIEALQKVVDTLIIIPNQNLFRLATEKTTFTEAFELADDVLYQGVKGVTDLMVRPGLINLDFADVRSIMDEMGKAMMGTGEATGEDRATQAAEKAIANPLLDEISLKGARGVLINITGGNDMTLFELDEAANSIRDEVDSEAKIMVGTTLDPSMDGTLRVSVVATGIDVKETSEEFLTKKVANTWNNPEEKTSTGNRPEIDYQDEKQQTAFQVQSASEGILQDRTIEDHQNFQKDMTTDEEMENTSPPQEELEQLSKSFTSEHIRQKLEAAVKKQPNPDLYYRPDRLSSPLTATPQKKTLHSIIQRMTGIGDSSRDDLREALAKQGGPRGRINSQETTGADLSRSTPVDDDMRVEVPAFLRRQAN